MRSALDRMRQELSPPLKKVVTDLRTPSPAHIAYTSPPYHMHPFCLRKATIQPRLFQKACRLASTRRKAVKPHPSILEQQPPRGIRREEEEDDDGSIRWFEKDMQTGVVKRLAGNPDEIEARELRAKIKALEAELKEYRSDESDESLMAAMEPQEKQKVELAIKKQKARIHDMTQGLEISHELPPLSVPLLKRLNTSLRDAVVNPTSVQHRKDLWRWYSRAKYTIPALPSMLPAKAWDVLWQSQSVSSPTNPDRLQHMSQLFEDMNSSGQPLNEQQKISRIETLLELDKPDVAAQIWQDEVDLANQSSPEILALGISVFTKFGDLDRAHHILQQYFTQYPDQDPRVALLLIAANVRVGNDHMAFALYLLLRSKLGSKMTMEDYDAVALQFLNNDKKDLALAIFRDMMLQGREAVKRDNSAQSKQAQLYAATFKRIDSLRSSAVSIDELNNMSLVSMTALPHEWQNKYFFGSWMKKLIGLGQLEAASKVVDLMYERGIDPDAKHINGLVGAYLRSTDANLQETGERLGWSMIQKRLDFAWERRRLKRGELALQPPLIHETREGILIPAGIARTTPRATIETFNVLALHYVIRQQWAHVRHLHQMLRPAEIKRDSFFMNQVLQAELYTNGHTHMWSNFLKLARATPLDMETYNLLWTASLRHLDQYRTEDRSGFPLPRPLFSMMLTWLNSIDSKQKAANVQNFDMQIYGKIIQSFCTDKDLGGCLVAMHAVAEHFGQYPDHNIAQIIITSVSNLPEPRAPTLRGRSGRRGRQQLPVSQARRENTAKVLQSLAKRRSQAAADDHGIDLEKLDPETKAKENLNLLSEFIRVVLVRTCAKADKVEPLIQQAGQAMGVPGITTGDIDASNVS